MPTICPERSPVQEASHGKRRAGPPAEPASFDPLPQKTRQARLLGSSLGAPIAHASTLPSSLSVTVISALWSFQPVGSRSALIEQDLEFLRSTGVPARPRLLLPVCAPSFLCDWHTWPRPQEGASHRCFTVLSHLGYRRISVFP